MTRELPGGLKHRVVIFLLGLAGYFFLEVLAIVVLAAALYVAFAAQAPLFLFLSVFTAGSLLLVSLGLHACLRARRFLLEFGRWTILDEDPASSQERRAMLAGARDAFHEGQFSRCASLLGRYLEARPQDSQARLNLACAEAMQGRFSESREALRLAGDPLNLARRLPESGKARWPSLSTAEAARAQSGISLPLLAFVGTILSSGLLLSLAMLAKGLGGAFLQASSPQAFALAMLKSYSNVASAKFKTAESEHFIYYFHDEAFMKKTAPLAEEALRFNSEFYVLPESTFSTRKIRLYLMNSQQDYMKWAPAAKSWEAAVTLDEAQEIYCYRFGKGHEWYFENTLAHEISHVCYRKILPQIEMGSWLNEGVAEHVGYEFALRRLGFPVAAWLKANVFKTVAAKPLPFDSFLSDNPQKMEGDEQIKQFYDQGFSIVHVLITYYGKDEFLNFLRQYSLKRDISKGLSDAYPSIRGVRDLQGIWLLFMK